MFGLSYNHVYGRIQAYQHGPTNAFSRLVFNEFSINENYLDGVSLTHGSEGFRQHIWSFSSAVGEIHESGRSSFIGRYCPCSGIVDWPYNTSFVGDDYFCDSGNHNRRFIPYHFLPDDPL